MKEQRGAAGAGASFGAVTPAHEEQESQADRREEGKEAGKQRIGYMHNSFIRHTTHNFYLPPV